MCFRFAILFFVLTAEVNAQELWLRPDKYFYEPNETAQVDLQSGEDFIGHPIKFFSTDLQSLTVGYRNSFLDIRRNFREGDKAGFSCNLFGDGIYQFRLETKPSSVHYARAAFAEFVRIFGLEDLNPDTVNVDSVSITLEKHFKCYVRVGREFDRRSEEVDSNFPLEIIPDKNPLILKRGDKITFTVLKKGKPAFGTRVRISNRWDNRTTIQHIYTQQDGTVSTTVSSPGDWMVAAVNVQKINDSEYAGHQFNLIFGYR
jgi:hypothetical protein